MADFLVKRDDLRECRIAEGPAPEVEPGQALLRVATFGLTANNVTYAVFGEAMSYWGFFPAEDGWGRVPMWGFAEVEASKAEGVEPGTRLYGYLPPSSHLVVTPGGAGPAGFVDASPHRAALPSAYHRYLATGPDAFYRDDTEEIQMLLRPLFFTSFLIDDQLDDDGLAHLAVSREIDEGGWLTLERVDGVIRDRAAVDPQGLDELGAPRRGEPYELDCLALRQQVRRCDRGLARGAGDHDRPTRDEPLVGELVVDQERGEEEGAQQHLYFLGVRAIEGIGVGHQIALVGRGQHRSVRRAVHEPVLVGVHGRNDEM